jgi:uncharacterized protein YbaP (TraB family)
MLPARFLILFTILWLAAAGARALPLWEIEGTSNRIYLLGSIHFLRAQDYPLPSAIGDTLEAADIVVMELDLASLNPHDTQAVILRLATDPQGRTLETLLGDGTYRRARKLAADIDIDLASMQAFEPWYATMQISQLRLAQLGFDGSHGVEVQLLMQATLLGKKIVGLETLEAQLTVLDSLPIEDQKKFLMQTLDDAAVMDTKIDDVVSAWKAGDTKKLQRDLMDGFSDQPTLYRQLIVQRNANWTERIMDMIDAPQNYLIVVGALHLVGDDSVQRMLADKGYSTRQLEK